ncbi:MAG: M42 family metallopeptidase [Nitrososphaerota archaeon]|nr:M42 family metallopeptidase [Candidatus Calditenuaceae archaeon]MDW8073987.1 M42 family metallopeptidase [Nitrososphaerota archaeon]
MDEALRLLERLSTSYAPPGGEDAVAGEIMAFLGGSIDSFDFDAMGNLIARVGGDGPRVMLAAHMDEVAMMVSWIDDEGFLSFTPVGGLDPRVLLGQRVVVHTEKGLLEGCIGAKPPHVTTQEEAKKAPEIRELHIDIGASSREEAEAAGVKMGSYVTFPAHFARLLGTRVMGKAFDDRAGCVVEALVARAAAEGGLGVELYAVFTVQEEVGLRGATTAVNSVNPRYAIVLEGTVAADTPGVPEASRVTRLGRGAAVRIMDSSMITNRGFYATLVKAAERAGVSYQPQIVAGSATDAGRIHLHGRGVATGVVGVPCRYLHSPHLILDLRDLEAAYRLTLEALKLISEQT